MRNPYIFRSILSFLRARVLPICFHACIQYICFDIKHYWRTEENFLLCVRCQVWTDSIRETRCGFEFPTSWFVFNEQNSIVVILRHEINAPLTSFVQPSINNYNSWQWSIHEHLKLTNIRLDIQLYFSVTKKVSPVILRCSCIIGFRNLWYCSFSCNPFGQISNVLHVFMKTPDT